jgi:hypothetical protein
VPTDPQANSPAPNAESALAAALQLPPGQTLDPARAAAICAALVDFAASLDTVVWSAWRAVAPASSIRRAETIRASLARAAGGEAGADLDAARDLELLRQLAAALIAGIGQAGRQFAQRHAERFAPSQIEAAARMSSSRGFADLVASHETRCWRKYTELAASSDAASVERELLGAVAAFAESLLRGVPGGGTRA